MSDRFDTATIRHLADIEEIDIESGASDEQPAVRRTIWVVVVDDDVYIRSVHGERGQWYQAVRAQPEGYVHAGGLTLPVRAIHVTAADTIQRVTAAYLSKYADSEWAPPMALPHTLGTTLRLVPRDPLGH